KAVNQDGHHSANRPVQSQNRQSSVWGRTLQSAVANRQSERRVQSPCMMKIQRVGVVGAGTMGNGIAQVFAQSGMDVRLVDAAPGALDRARASIDKSLGKLVEKSRLTPEERDATIARLATGTNVDLLADIDYVVEAIFEDREAKLALFARLDQLT